MISINWTATSNHFLQSPFLWEIIKFMRWLVGTKQVPESKNTPRIQNTSQNPKYVPETKDTPQHPKTHPRIQSTSQRQKILPRTQNTSENPTVFWNLGSILDSWMCFWFFGMGFGFLQCSEILGRVLDSGKCFVPWATISSGAFCKEWPPWWISTKSQQSYMEQ